MNILILNNECDITGRFLNETNKGIYQLDTMNAEELVISLEKNILNIIVPVINEGISKYFELFLHYDIRLRLILVMLHCFLNLYFLYSLKF